MKYWQYCLVGVLCSALCLPALAKKHVQPTLRAVEHNNRGAALLNDGKLSEAEFELKTAVQLTPGYSEALNNLGIVYKRLHRYETAIEHFEAAYDSNKDFISPLSHIGAVHIAQGKYESAAKILKKALRKDPTFTYAVYNLGLSYLLQARESKTGKSQEKLYAKAEEQFTIATQLNPHFYEAHLNLGDLYAETGKPEKATIRYRLAMQDNRRDPRPYRALAALEANAGNAKESSRLQQSAKSMEKESAAAQAFEQGVALAAEGEQLRAAHKPEAAELAFTRARDAFRTALKHSPNHTEAHYGLGVVLSRLHDTKGATKAWDRVLALHPNHPGALYNLGTQAFAKDRSSEGLHYWCRFLQIQSYQFAEQHRMIADHLKERELQCPN